MNAASSTRGLTRFWGWFALASCFAAGWGFAPAIHAADVAVTQPRVVMMDFTSDDGLMRSAAGAAQWSALAQDALARQLPDLVWIERSQLNLAANELNLAVTGLTDADSPMRVGKWLKADLAILGGFSRNENDADGHTLRLDVVDLRRADTLATRTIRVDGDRRAAVAVDPARVADTVAALRAALAEAEGKLAHAPNQKVLAPLFIRNADVSPRLDPVQGQLMDALAQAASRAADVRVLRFPHADEARGEADLAVRGLTEGDADAWQRVADLYVWGSYHELPGPETAFAQTPVEVELTLWDGVAAPRQITERTVVSQVPALARRLAGQCLDAARRVPAVRPAPATVREEIARALREQGQRLDASAATHGERRETFLATPAGKALRSQERMLLEAACFFAPLDRATELARLQARWERFPAPTQRLPLLDLWRRSDDLANLAARYQGSGDEAAIHDLALARVTADAYLLEWLQYGENQLHVPRSEPNLPVDATDAQIAAWRTALDGRFTRDAVSYAAVTRPPPNDPGAGPIYAGWMVAALQMMHDPADAARVVDAVWPLYKPLYQKSPAEEDARFGHEKGGLAANLERLYARLRQPERAKAILASIPTGGAPSADPIPDGAKLVTEVSSVQLPGLTPKFRTLPFPPAAPASDNTVPGEGHGPQFVVQNLTLDGDEQFWINVSRRRAFQYTGPSRTLTQELWRFDPADDSLKALPVDGLTLETPITSVLPQANGAWLTVGFLGVLQYDPGAARVTRRHTVADGLLTPNMDAAVVTMDGHLYFAGHEGGRPLLNRFDPGGAGWVRVDLSAPPDDSPTPPRGMPVAEPATQITAFQRWLLVRLGGSWTLLDTAAHRSQSLREALPANLAKTVAAFGEKVPHPASSPDRQPLPRPRPCAADAHGFWIVLDGKIIQFDPGHPGAARSWPLPQQLLDGVTALASDGEDVWLAGPPGIRSVSPGNTHRFGRPNLGFDGRGFVAVMHAADGRWRGGFELPATVGCLAIARNTVYVDQQAAARPLLEIDKRSTLSGVAP